MLSDSEDVRVLLECAITIWENRSTSLMHGATHLRTLLSRDTRLAHRLQSHLTSRLVHDSTGLVSAVLGVWPDFVPSSSQGLCGGNLWFFLDTAPSNTRIPQRVHYNIFTGQLLVNGKPLGRLPMNITSHIFYDRTFGKVKLSLIPYAAH
jgi:hypothetical protein